jgi:hypothetical protein
MRRIQDFKAVEQGFGRRLLCICVAALLVYGIVGATAPGFKASAATPKYRVALTIEMGKKGSSCPELRFAKGDKEYMVQAVGKWYIDGRQTKDPWSKFYSKGWDFKNHSVTVLMNKKLSKGTYKVSMDNGDQVKPLGEIKVESKDVRKTFRFD